MQTYLCEQDNAEIIAMVGKGPYGKKQGGYQPGRFQRKTVDASEMLCFKCVEKGHLYSNCPVKGKVECARCGEAHATKMHDNVKLIKERMAAKGGKAAWRNKPGGYGAGRDSNVGHADHSDPDGDQDEASEEMDMYERTYSSMTYCQNVRQDMDKEKLDDEYDIKDINAMLTRLTDVDRRKN